jgi:hypothetical protein
MINPQYCRACPNICRPLFAGAEPRHLKASQTLLFGDAAARLLRMAKQISS